MNWFKMWEDYDKLQEPYQLWFMLYIMMPFFIGLALMETHPEWVIGVIYGCLLGIYRIIYLMRGIK